MNFYAFISYQTKDKWVAGKLKKILGEYGIDTFLAHEDINVSEEWRVKILEELTKADIFICILSKNFLQSFWCLQESGIAAFRSDLTVIPISIDGTIPVGFIGNIQCAKMQPDSITINDLLPGLLKRNFNIGIHIIIDIIAKSSSYRGAESNFELILPHLEKLSPEHGKSLLEACSENSQVYDAGLCAGQYIPRALKLFGNTLSNENHDFLMANCKRYNAVF